MYCYFPNDYFGEHKVAWVNGVDALPGDLVQLDEKYAVVLGEHIAHHELITTHQITTQTTLLIPSFCSLQLLTWVEEFVTTWFTSYTHALPLWFGADFMQLIKIATKVKTTHPVTRHRSINLDASGHIVFSSAGETTTQQMLVFPDLWTMHQQLPQRLFTQPGVVRWHSGLTSRQQAVIYWGCKTGVIHTLVTTSAGIFQDWHDLQHVFLIDAHKRRYKSVQEPRYWVPTVVKQLGEHRKISVEYTGYLIEAVPSK